MSDQYWMAQVQRRWRIASLAERKPHITKNFGMYECHAVRPGIDFVIIGVGHTAAEAYGYAAGNNKSNSEMLNMLDSAWPTP